MNFHNYLIEFQNSIQRKDGKRLSTLLTYQDKDHSQSDRLLNYYSEDKIATHISMPWNDICIFHINTCLRISELNFIQAFKEHANLIQFFTKSISSMNNENWMLPVLNVLIRDLRLLAIAADLADIIISKNDKHKSNVYLEQSQDLLMGIFRITATDFRGNIETSKRKSMINTINQMFKIYFKINKINMCKPLIRAFQNANIPSNLFDLSERVTFNYYLGIKNMFDSNYREADSLLSFSFRNCHPNSFKNKSLILIFLIPVKMLIGTMPSSNLLKQYNLMQFEDIVKSVKQGNLRLFDKTLEQNSDFFWKYGIYLILEKLRIIAYRNIFKKVMLISKTFQVPISQFQIALNYLQDEETSIEELHCILANLISDGKIKGYISLQHQKLVFSKNNAFPPLSSIA